MDFTVILVFRVDEATSTTKGGERPVRLKKTGTLSPQVRRRVLAVSLDGYLGSGYALREKGDNVLVAFDSGRREWISKALLQTATMEAVDSFTQAVTDYTASVRALNPAEQPTLPPTLRGALSYADARFAEHPYLSAAIACNVAVGPMLAYTIATARGDEPKICWSPAKGVLCLVAGGAVKKFTPDFVSAEFGFIGYVTKLRGNKVYATPVFPTPLLPKTEAEKKEKTISFSENLFIPVPLEMYAAVLIQSWKKAVRDEVAQLEETILQDVIVAALDGFYDTGASTYESLVSLLDSMSDEPIKSVLRSVCTA